MSNSIQRLNQEVLGIITSYGQTINLQEDQTEEQKFQILFTKMKSIINSSEDISQINNFTALVDRLQGIENLNSECLDTIHEISSNILSRKELLYAELRTKPDLEILITLGLNTWNASSEAKDRIITCFRQNNTKLDLSRLDLTYIPANLIKFLPNLHTLNLDNNQLTTFTLEGTTRLKNLFLNNNRLTTFNLTETSQLRVIGLGHNQLTTFNLTGAPRLQNLFLYNNRLTTFNLTGAPGLQNLNLGNNELTTFNLTGAPGLQNLHLGNNELTTFTLIGTIQLKRLYLQNNQLEVEPDISLYPNLEISDFSNNPFMQAIRVDQDTPTLDQRLNVFTRIIPKETSPEIATLRDLTGELLINALQDNPTLIQGINVWLQKLQIAKDFKDPIQQKIFAPKVLAILDLAIKKPSFRKILDLALQVANTSCVDRAALFLNTAEEAKMLYTIKDVSWKDALSLLKGMYALEITDRISTDFVRAHRIICEEGSYYPPEKVFMENGIRYIDGVDPIEVHLGFQVRLKQTFSLPIATEGMNYSICSGISSEDEQRAKNIIRIELSNEEGFSNYLSKMDAWKKKVQTTFAEELDEKLEPFNDLVAQLDTARAELSSQQLTNAMEEIAEGRTAAIETWIKEKTKEILNTSKQSRSASSDTKESPPLKKGKHT